MKATKQTQTAGEQKHEEVTATDVAQHDGINATDDGEQMSEVEATDEEIPADELCTVALRDALEKFNAGARERDALTAADISALNHISALTAEFQRARERSVREAEEWASIRTPSSSLVTDVGGYVVKTRSEKEETFSHGVERTPAVQGIDYRAWLYAAGTKIINDLNAEIAESHRRVEAIQAARVRLREHVAVWLRDSTIRKFMIGVLAVDNDPRFEALHNMRGDLYRSLRFLQRAVVNHDPNLPDALPLARHGRFWVAEANRLLRDELAT